MVGYNYITLIQPTDMFDFSSNGDVNCNTGDRINMRGAWVDGHIMTYQQLPKPVGLLTQGMDSI